MQAAAEPLRVFLAHAKAVSAAELHHSDNRMLSAGCSWRLARTSKMRAAACVAPNLIHSGARVTCRLCSAGCGWRTTRTLRNRAVVLRAACASLPSSGASCFLHPAMPAFHLQLFMSRQLASKGIRRLLSSPYFVESANGLLMGAVQCPTAAAGLDCGMLCKSDRFSGHMWSLLHPDLRRRRQRRMRCWCTSSSSWSMLRCGSCWSSRRCVFSEV